MGQSSDDSKPDQRSFTRVPTKNFVAYEVPDHNPGFYRLGLTKSLSKGGMSFEIDHSFPPGKLLRFQFNLEDELIEAHGVVLYSLERIPGSFDVGIKFMDIPEHDAESLEAWFRRHGGTSSPAA
jgi:hypothetical protein